MLEAVLVTPVQSGTSEHWALQQHFQPWKVEASV